MSSFAIYENKPRTYPYISDRNYNLMNRLTASMYVKSDLNC